MAKKKIANCGKFSGVKLKNCRSKAVDMLVKQGTKHVDAVARVNKATKKR